MLVASAASPYGLQPGSLFLPPPAPVLLLSGGGVRHGHGAWPNGIKGTVHAVGSFSFEPDVEEKRAWREKFAGK